MRPFLIPEYIKEYWNSKLDSQALAAKTKLAYQKLKKDAPEVTIVIPAYNEEKMIVRTLHSICQNDTAYPFEIIVVNNNSSDRTAELVEACGVTCLFEPKQGITYARNTGLKHARGKYIINADADTIYPRNWIQAAIEPLKNNERIALTYGQYSFLPLYNTKRLTYFFYECIADLSRTINKYFRDEAVNVYGFCSAFRREQALLVGGYSHPAEANEDGYLALKLRNRGFGKLHRIHSAFVWTTDRRIHSDGGLMTGGIKRFKRVVGIKKGGGL